MKQTPNINLPILEQSDKYLKETQNEAFSVIDREIAGLNSAISVLDNVEGSIVDTKSDVETLKNETNTLKASLNDMASNVIPNIQTSLETKTKYPILETEYKDGECTVKNVTKPYHNPKRYGALGDGVTDDTIAIQNCFDNGLKKVVFEESGTYCISSSIIIPFDTQADLCWSTIVPIIGGSFLRNCMFLINDDGTNWIRHYPGKHGVFKNAYFENTHKLENIKCLYLHAQNKIENIRTSYMYGVIERGINYLDMVEISGISITNIQGNAPQIMISNVGDGLSVARIHYSDVGNTAPCIQINNCYGGKVERIINGNIVINNCKGVSINNLHLEYGGIDINTSCISINDSYLWNTEDRDYLISQNSSSSYHNSNVTYKNCIFNTTPRHRTQNRNNVHLKINGGIATIINCFATHGLDGNLSNFSTSGIKTNIEEFNRNSSVLSNLCTIENGKVLTNSAIIVNKELENYYPMGENISLSSNGGDFKRPIGIYYYYPVLLFDYTRKIGIPGWAGKRQIYVGDRTQAIRFTLSTSNSLIGGNTRLYRSKTDGSYNEYVDIPYKNNSDYYYDDGDNVNGFVWQERTNSNIENFNTATRVEFVGKNIIAYMTNAPTQGEWTKGDRVVNTNINIGQVKAWSYNGTEWISEGVY